MNKQGSIFTNETLELILAAVVVALLIFFLIRLISPKFSYEDETAKNYMAEVKQQMAVAKSGGVGQVLFWHFPKDFDGRSKRNSFPFYLVYFAEDKQLVSTPVNHTETPLVKVGFQDIAVPAWAKTTEEALVFRHPNNKPGNIICVCYPLLVGEKVETMCKYCEHTDAGVYFIDAPLASPALYSGREMSITYGFSEKYINGKLQWGDKKEYVFK